MIISRYCVLTISTPHPDPPLWRPKWWKHGPSRPFWLISHLKPDLGSSNGQCRSTTSRIRATLIAETPVNQPALLYYRYRHLLRLLGRVPSAYAVCTSTAHQINLKFVNFEASWWLITSNKTLFMKNTTHISVFVMSIHPYFSPLFLYYR